MKPYDLGGQHYEFMIPADQWAEIIYQHEDAHAEHGAVTEDAAWLYAFAQTGYLH